MEAIILVGGFGTRLADVIKDVPKPMAPIRGVPFLTFILKHLKKYGYKRVILAIGYLGNQIIDHYGENFEGIEIAYSIESKPLGTGGSIIQALKFTSGEYVLVLNGDTFFDVNLIDLKRPKDILIIAKYLKDTSRYGRLEIKDNKVVGYHKPNEKTSGFINGGIYYLSRSVFDNFELPLVFSFENDFLFNYCDRLDVEYLLSDGYFIDIGIPSDYDRAKREL